MALLEGQDIQDAIGSAQEVLHLVKLGYKKAFMAKVDLSKAFDCINSLYINLILMQVGFAPLMIQWIEACFNRVVYTILINGTPANSIHPPRGHRQRCPLSPLLFFPVEEGLILLIKSKNQAGALKGMKVEKGAVLSNLIFVDNLLLFGNGIVIEAKCLGSILTQLCDATAMELYKSPKIIHSFQPD